MSIEFFGLPGAGKTTLAKRLSRERSIPVVTISGKREKYYHSARFFLRHPVVFSRLFRRVFSKTTLKDRRLLRYKITRLMLPALAREAKAQRFDEYIIDEGILQFLYSLHEHRISEHDLLPFGSFLSAMSATAYIVEADSAARYRRMEERQGTPRKRFGDAYFTQWRAISEANYSVIRAFIQARMSYRVIEN